MKYKLGKREPSCRQSVSFGDFLTVIPTHPLVDFAPNYTYPMDGNDTVGDCVVAGFDHARQTITGLLTGTQQNFTQQQIWDLYKTQNPNFPTEDNGMDIQTFLEYLVANKYILGFALVDYTNKELLRSAIYLGLAIMTGVQLRQAQMTQFETGMWDYVNSPIEGGHCVPANGYNNSPDILDFVSWGKLIGGTQNFVTNQMDEAWFILTQEHVDHPDFRNHFDLAGFSQAVAEITNNKVIIPMWKYFNPTESTGGGHTVAELNVNLVNMLDKARGIAGVPFVITSGMRTVAQNQAVGGVSNSAHLVGMAADIAVTDATRQKVLTGLLTCGVPCFIEDAVSHIHADIDSNIHTLGWAMVSGND